MFKLVGDARTDTSSCRKTRMETYENVSFVISWIKIFCCQSATGPSQENDYTAKPRNSASAHIEILPIRKIDFGSNSLFYSYFLVSNNKIHTVRHEFDQSLWNAPSRVRLYKIVRTRTRLVERNLCKSSLCLWCLVPKTQSKAYENLKNLFLTISFRWS